MNHPNIASENQRRDWNAVLATYVIVSSTKDPLDPGEIHAGATISVADSDIFIVDPSADANVGFVDGGGATNFEVQFAATNSNVIKLTVNGGLEPTINIASGVNSPSVTIEATNSDGLTLNVGDNVTLGKVTGSTAGADTVTVGNGFTTTHAMNFGNGDNDITFGNDASITSLQTGTGVDQIIFGDRANFVETDGGTGNDALWFGDDIVGTRIKGGTGDDLIRVGANASLTEINGEGDNDTLFTQTTGLSLNNIENVSVVCFAPGTLIDTPDGPRPVQDLQVGDLVTTLDHGPQTIRWVRTSDHPLETAEPDDKPVLIAAGAFGPNRPAQDLIVSPQHRMFVGGSGQLDGWFTTEAFAPAKSLTAANGIRHMKGKQIITWIHFACDRHEVVTANGCLSESLLLGPMVVNGLTRQERRELSAIYGSAPTPDEALNGPAARECLKVGQVRRHLAECKKEKRRRNAKETGKWDVDLAMEQYEADRSDLKPPKGQKPNLRLVA